MDEQTQIRIESMAFRRLLEHLRQRTDVQNIDLMNMSGFCRNCLSKWLKAASDDMGVTMSYDDARQWVYGMPYEDWKQRYQTEATSNQLTTFAAKKTTD
ncbi:MAG: DUF1244 domain-containing protein [Myxococcales bacterium]|nr:DUF1244 domain-containing protein [Myxococcales bacterium]